MRDTTHGRALEQAALVLGSEAALAVHLKISRARLALYLAGTARCPDEVVRKLVPLVAGRG